VLEFVVVRAVHVKTASGHIRLLAYSYKSQN